MITIHPSFGEPYLCDCCNTITESTFSDIFADGQVIGSYLARWTKSDMHKGIAFFIIRTENGIDCGYTVEYRHEINAFIVKDPTDHKWPSSLKPGRLYLRNEIVNTPKAKSLYDLLDIIWVQDANLAKSIA